MDPGFKYHRAVGQVWAEISRRLSDSVLLPLNFTTYAEHLLDEWDRLKGDYGEAMRKQNINLGDENKEFELFWSKFQKALYSQASTNKPQSL